MRDMTIGAGLWLVLLGTAACQSVDLHPPPVETQGPMACVTCHQPQYEATVLPPHAAIGIGTACADCHAKTAWHPATGFDHAQFWPLTGKHVGPACAACHTTPGQKPSAQCVGCHQADYDATQQPKHAQAGIPTACGGCHSTQAWQPAALDHDAFFPLTGRHATLDCAACHATPGDKPAKTCVGCHQADYTAAKTPSHVVLGLPTTCQTCHTTTAWQPAQFPAHAFPIQAGKHGGIACATCHTNPADFQTFTCMASGCHGKAQTDDDHDEVGGYVYAASACLQCHPTGKED